MCLSKMCPWTCKHHQCSSKCSDKCSIPLCEESCTELLKCGHVCSGFCGDPCPQLCLVCDAEKLPPQLDNARYVLLEECGHAIEVRTLDAWMMKPCQEVGLKTCPECTLPVHYCRRYSDIIRNTHLELSVVLKMYMERRPQISAPYVMNSLRDFMSVEYFSKELYTLMVTMKMVPKQKSKKQNSGQKTPQNTQALSYNELRLIHFKANVLRKACMIKAYINKSRHKMSFHLQSSQVWHLVFQLDTLVKHVMNLTCYEASEVIEGVNSELQRLLLLPSFWYFDKEYKAKKSDHMKDVHEKLCVIFDPKNKFTIEQEHEVLSLLKQCNLAGNLIIYDQRRITSAMGVKNSLQGV
nr:NFX1-type zinc finger-containing protein 1-like [Cherax quadricarinatus]